MAIVEEVLPDKNDVMRTVCTVAVRTSTRQFIRDIRSLVPLPISDDDDDEPEGSSQGECVEWILGEDDNAPISHCHWYQFRLLISL